MGSGQSKFGFGKQKQHYPFPTPTFPGYGPQFPQPYVPQYGLAGYPPQGPPTYPQPQIPQQGFIPPGIYGQGGFIPPSQPKAPHRERRSKKRKSRRTHSENFAGGFAGEAAQGEVEPRRAHSESHHRNDGPSMPVPEIQRSATVNHPPKGVNRRAPTPFIPPLGGDEEDHEDDRERDLNRNHSRQSNVRYSEPHHIDGNIRNVLQPIERGNSAVYGPSSTRPRTPLKNPLPPPPRDIYDMTPYRAIVNLPHTTALLAGPYGPQSLSYANAAADLDSSTSVKRNKSVKGILRAFSKREKPKEPQNRVQYVPIFVEPGSQDLSQPQISHTQGSQVQVTMPQAQMPQPQMPQSQMPQSQMPQPQGPHSQMPQHDLHRSSSQHSRNPGGSSMPMPDYLIPQNNNVRFPSGPNDSSPMHSHSSSSADTPIPPVPPVPSSPPPVRFGQGDALNGFLNHSVYRILYRNKTYPTGLHLHEAMKFIDHRPDIAETIRGCADVHSVYPLAGQFQQFQRADWPQVYVDCMEQVVLLKVRQHPDLRTLLMGTGTARIEYSDEHDDFWGTGPNGDGQNTLGKVMMRVREKLRVEAL